jgi:hypothetical protein
MLNEGPFVPAEPEELDPVLAAHAKVMPGVGEDKSSHWRGF